MKLRFISVGVFFMFLMSCVKNEPFLQAYSVPPTYDFQTFDSSASVQTVMMYGLKNYLATGVNAKLDTTIIDSLWNNRGAQFTEAMVPNFVHSANALNNAAPINLLSSIDNVDSLMFFTDSAFYSSAFYNDEAIDGKPGSKTITQPTSEKKLFSKDGVVYDEVLFHAMLGAMSLRNITAKLATATGPGVSVAWDLAYTYIGLPKNYDPNFNYGDAINRPLGIAAYFSTVGKNFNAGLEIYEEFRRGRSALTASDLNVGAISTYKIYYNLERCLAATTIEHLNSVKNFSDLHSKLNALSKAFGLAFALQYRPLSSGENIILTAEDYELISKVFRERFYTLVTDTSYTKINEVISLLSKSYQL